MRLSLSLLGPFRAMLDEQPVTAFKSNKVRALLAYLAAEAHQPHRREVLAGLLWPDWPDRDALNNLRYALSDLRQATGDRAAAPPFLLISRDELQFNPASDYSLDARVLVEAGEALRRAPPPVEALERAANLYNGPFLDGFSLNDCPAFEQWVLWTRERLARHFSAIVHHLADTYEQRGDYDRAQAYAWRQLEHEPCDEGAHRLLMRTMALSGERASALAQYQTCRRLLEEELGVEPSPETAGLYEKIRDGVLKRPSSPSRQPALPSRLPPFLRTEPPAFEQPLFVAREAELARLHAFLDQALAHRGGIVFVTGEAGSGKTALLHEFIRRAQSERAELVVASGTCNAYTGVGDPYLPFREILGLLTGDVEAKWAAGAMTRDQATRLWDTLPAVAQILPEAGPDLVDTFVTRVGLLDRARNYASEPAEWLNGLLDLVASHSGMSSAPALQQRDLFEQYARVVVALSRHAPLLLVLDDLQWADAGSISLLFHLGRQLQGSRVLLVGEYRSEEVAIGRHGARHPLEPVANELQRDFGNITVDLGQAEGREFVEEVLDSEGNLLGAGFREMLHNQTRGHPLFTIELLRGLQDRGDLLQDSEGRWIEGPSLDWDSLPARVEAVIAERIKRLDEPLRAILRTASVEGEVFTAEVIARIRAIDERDAVRLLSNELDRTHRLIRADSIERVDGQLLSHYRFRHILFQRYLYSSQDDVEKVHLHERIGIALEELYGSQEQAAAMAVQLALHFEKARITGKTIRYLHLAANKALHLSAYEEARAHLTRAIQLLESQPDSPERTEQELALQLSVVIAWIGASARPEWENAVNRARVLSEQTGRMTDLCYSLGQLAKWHYVRAEHAKARELGAEALRLAAQLGDPLLVTINHWYVGFILFALGEFAQARNHLAHTIASYDPRQHHQRMVLAMGSDAGLGALAYDACCLWCLGYPEQALRRSREALALARDLAHALTLVDVLCFAGCLFNTLTGDPLALKEAAEELARISNQMGFSAFRTTGAVYVGQALAESGATGEGIAEIREGLARLELTGGRCHKVQALGSLAKAEARAGKPDQALATFDGALEMVEETDERYYEAELLRLRGELLLVKGDQPGAEASLLRAIDVARRQDAKMWELRAATSLGRLWTRQGRDAEARSILAPVYNWFSEGFETADLSAAAALLAELK